jgi:hypothetical protein
MSGAEFGRFGSGVISGAKVGLVEECGEFAVGGSRANRSNRTLRWISPSHP